MWERIGVVPSPETKLLDFGCGAGERVFEFRRKGFDAVGCDVALPGDAEGVLPGLIDRGIVLPIAPDPYRLPSDDQTFDIVYSITVFEHVMDYDSALAESQQPKAELESARP